ncbi:OST-HTH/LOTUS domain-containing protein [Coraliomargarita sp. SDUM461003]|uniref:OST-HTH/LOTUS domain-containing protein n=1 Tax=Thalassobacterium maritimum TaxID=3041265 RepID=A0ABU1ASP4_9BACT|nr:OST-HTH/LOTUS domain-containing protein [Coraliomargarita sp. SDUM461003]MDQ8207181.1 OST-HTH/LOTUS domain-containing protein [Coraliomargarita sp. SDUM461003]
MRLREESKQVFGFGGKNTPGPFISSCTKFFYLEEAEAGAAQAQLKADSVEQLKQNTKLMNILRSAVKAAENDEGWARLGPVGSYITNQGPFDHRTYGFKKLSDLFRAIDLFQVRENKTANQVVVEVKLGKGAPKKKAAKKKVAKKYAKKAGA